MPEYTEIQEKQLSDLVAHACKDFNPYIRNLVKRYKKILLTDDLKNEANEVMADVFIKLFDSLKKAQEFELNFSDEQTMETMQGKLNSFHVIKDLKNETKIQFVSEGFHESYPLPLNSEPHKVFVPFFKQNTYTIDLDPSEGVLNILHVTSLNKLLPRTIKNYLIDKARRHAVEVREEGNEMEKSAMYSTQSRSTLEEQNIRQNTILEEKEKLEERQKKNKPIEQTKIRNTVPPIHPPTRDQDILLSDYEISRNLPKLIHYMFNVLTDNLREPLLLFCAGFSYDDIAEDLGITKKLVTSRIKNARLKLANEFPDTVALIKEKK